VDIKQLKALVTVAEVGSVTRAAELLHLVQPAVTRQIRTLEHELGIALFERTRQGMHLTEAGATLVERARRALNELERARAEIQPAPGVVTGIVTVGLLGSASDLLAEPLVSAVARGHPGIEVVGRATDVAAAIALHLVVSAICGGIVCLWGEGVSYVYVERQTHLAAQNGECLRVHVLPQNHAWQLVSLDRSNQSPYCTD